MPAFSTTPSGLSRRSLSADSTSHGDVDDVGELSYPDSDCQDSVDDCKSRGRRSLPILQRIDVDDVGELSYPDSDCQDSAAPSFSPPSLKPAHTPPATARTSHVRQRPNQQPPRPPNAFILFRSDYCIWNKKQHGAGVIIDHRIVSKQAGKAWGDLDTKVRKKYHVLADERKRLHTLQYPDYTYNPVGRGKKRKADEEAKETIPFPSSPIARPSKQARLSPIRSSAPSPEFEPTPDLSPNTPSESSDANLSIPTPEDTSFRPEMTSGDDFIPTADIPPLDLYAKEEAKDIRADYSLRPSSSYDVGSQFFKPEISKDTREGMLWYNMDGTYTSSASSTLNSSAVEGCPRINYAEVQFTNPFGPFETDFAMGDLIHIDRFN